MIQHQHSKRVKKTYYLCLKCLYYNYINVLQANRYKWCQICCIFQSFYCQEYILNWPSASVLKHSTGKVVYSFFEGIQLQIIKCFIYDYLIKLMHCILSSLSSPMENLGSSKDYLLLGRKWVDTVIGYFICFKNRLSDLKSNAQHIAHTAGVTSRELQKPIHFNLQQLISPPTVSRTHEPNSFLYVVLLKQFVLL